MKYLKTFNEITESEKFDTNDGAIDESFFRLPSAIIGNELFAVAKNLNSFYDNANAGNDIDTSVLDSIIKKLSMIKKAAKKFNNPEEVKGTVFESLDEAVQVDTSRYERSHGKKPRGKGSWAFYFDRAGGDAMFTPSAMTYADAVNWAKEQAKEAGKSVVYVGESETTNESADVKDIKVGSILKFTDGETWKVTKFIGNPSNPRGVFALPHGDTKKNYVSVALEFSISDLEKSLESLNESFDVSGISRQDLRQVLNLLDTNDISYDFDGREEILDFDLTELGKKDQDQLKKLGITESAINEEKYTVIDPNGNQMGASDKMQAISIAKKNGGETAGYFVVSNKNALKARRALEKFKGDFKDPKLKDMMADLYESVNEAFEVIYTNQNVRGSKKFSNQSKALAFAETLIAQGANEVDVFNAGGNFNSSADTGAVIAWYGNGTYMDNMSKKDPKLAAKKMNKYGEIVGQ